MELNKIFKGISNEGFRDAINEAVEASGNEELRRVEFGISAEGLRDALNHNSGVIVGSSEVSFESSDDKVQEEVNEVISAIEEAEDEEGEAEEPANFNIAVGDTKTFVFRKDVPADIDLVEKVMNDDQLCIVSDDETKMVYCASGYMIGRAEIVGNEYKLGIFMDEAIMDNMRTNLNANLNIAGTTNRGWKDVTMDLESGVYTIDDIEGTPADHTFKVGSINLRGETHESFDLSEFNWFIKTIK